jgi:hypothetical protein
MQLCYDKWPIVILATLLLAGCVSQNVEQALTPLPEGETIDVQDLDITSGQTNFVPAYSEVHYASEGRPELWDSCASS